jgi:polysaccharide pyruvyl transferase CsaB
MQIGVIGNYGAGNIGDEMILKGVLTMLRELFPYAEILVFSANPKETEKIHYVRAVKKIPAGFRSFIRAFFYNPGKKELKKCDFVILGGGGLFAGPEKKANMIWGIQAFYALRYKKPLIICGQSLGEFRSWFEKFIIRNVFSRAKLINLRDLASKQRLKKLGIRKKIYTSYDMAFRSRLKPIAVENKKIVAIALRQQKQLSNKFKNNISDFLNWLIEKKDYQLRFLNFQKGKDQDRKLHREISENIKDKTKVEMVYIKDINQTFDGLNDIEFIIGMRFHSILSAIKINKPFIAINYATKLKDCLDYLDLKEYLLEMEEINQEKLKEKYRMIKQEEKAFKNQMQKVINTAEEKQKEFERAFKKLFN